MAGTDDSDGWLEAFHRGERPTLEAIYCEHYVAVARAVGSIVRGPESENIIHDVFLHLIGDEAVRRGFTGGSLAAWLQTMAKHRAIDSLRRTRRGAAVSTTLAAEPDDSPSPIDEEAFAHILIEQFKQHHLPAKWAPVFEARFIRQQSQREAAESLNTSRTTLAYQEHRVRKLLRKFLLETET